MKVYVRYKLEGEHIYKTGETPLDSVAVFQETLFILEELVAIHEKSIFTDTATIKKFLPHICFVYLIEEISNARFLHGQDFAEQCREQGIIGFEKTPDGAQIARIDFEKEPNPEVLQIINRDFLKISEVITEYSENIILELCIELNINPQFSVMMPPVHWVVCPEYPKDNFYLLFPDEC